MVPHLVTTGDTLTLTWTTPYKVRNTTEFTALFGSSVSINGSSVGLASVFDNSVDKITFSVDTTVQSTPTNVYVDYEISYGGANFIVDLETPVEPQEKVYIDTEPPSVSSSVTINSVDGSGVFFTLSFDDVGHNNIGDSSGSSIDVDVKMGESTVSSHTYTDYNSVQIIGGLEDATTYVLDCSFNDSVGNTRNIQSSSFITHDITEPIGNIGSITTSKDETRIPSIRVNISANDNESNFNVYVALVEDNVNAQHIKTYSDFFVIDNSESTIKISNAPANTNYINTPIDLSGSYADIVGGGTQSQNQIEVNKTYKIALLIVDSSNNKFSQVVDYYLPLVAESHVLLNGTSNVAKEGDTITLDIVFNYAVDYESTDVIIAGNNVTPVKINEYTFRAELTTTAVNISTGYVTYTIPNVNPALNDVVSSLFFDREPPVLTLSQMFERNSDSIPTSSTSVSLNVNISDNYIGVRQGSSLDTDGYQLSLEISGQPTGGSTVLQYDNINITSSNVIQNRSTIPFTDTYFVTVNNGKLFLNGIQDFTLTLLRDASYNFVYNNNAEATANPIEFYTNPDVPYTTTFPTLNTDTYTIKFTEIPSTLYYKSDQDYVSINVIEPSTSRTLLAMFSGLLNSTSYTVTGTLTDKAGNESTDQIIVKTRDDQPPVINNIDLFPGITTATPSIDVTVDGGDEKNPFKVYSAVFVSDPEVDNIDVNSIAEFITDNSNITLMTPELVNSSTTYEVTKKHEIMFTNLVTTGTFDASAVDMLSQPTEFFVYAVIKDFPQDASGVIFSENHYNLVVSHSTILLANLSDNVVLTTSSNRSGTKLVTDGDEITINLATKYPVRSQQELENIVKSLTIFGVDIIQA